MDLQRLLDDLEYLFDMRRLEDNPREKSMHIVPISGLCVGRVVRLESEMRTVVEVWGAQFANAYRSSSASILEEDLDSLEDDEESSLVVIVSSTGAEALTKSFMSLSFN